MRFQLPSDHCRLALEYPDLKRAVRHQAKLYGARQVLIEDRASGVQLVQELRAEGVAGVTAVSPKGDKTVRMLEQTPQIEDGLVHLPERAPWLEEFLEEVMQFPKSRNDDQVDALAQALKWAVQGNDIDEYIKFLRRRDGLDVVDEIPTIRIRHKEQIGMRLQTQSGRNPIPFSDCSFLVTESEFTPWIRAAGFEEFTPEEPEELL